MASMVFIQVATLPTKFSLLRQILLKAWKYAKDVFVYFVDLEKAYDGISRDKLWKMLHEYGIDG